MALQLSGRRFLGLGLVSSYNAACLLEPGFKGWGTVNADLEIRVHGTSVRQRSLLRGSGDFLQGTEYPGC